MSKFNCLCRRSFSSQNALNGHKSHCKIYQIHKHGTLKNFKQAEINRHSKSIKTWKNKSRKYQIIKKEKEREELNNWLNEKHKCKRCGRIMFEKFGSGIYCSRSCANKRVYSKDKAKEIRKKTKWVC